LKRIAVVATALALWLPQPLAADPTMQQQMSEIFEAMRYLLPLSLDEKKFADPARREKIDKALALLANSSQRLEVHGHSDDAGFSYLSRALAVDARDIHQRFEAGYVQEARFLVQQLTDTCVACHSTLPSPGTRLRPRLANDEMLAGLPLDQRAKIEYATRQFDKALESYEALLASKEFSATDLDMLGLLDDYLELCIRVLQNFEEPIRSLEKFAKRSDLNLALRGEVHTWITSLQELSRRKPKAGALDEARALLREIAKNGRFNDERDALVYYLQASGVLHRYLDKPPHSPSDLAEAYYLLGSIETQVGKSFWLSQAEAYLEAAIRTAPRDPTAQRAYDLLEEFLVAGYTGSEGTHVPPDIQAHLDELRALCENPPPS
jgi:tetratricopeptide (TPR) repeat protein